MGAKILLLDDELMIRDMLPLLLSRAGHTIITVSTGEEAIHVYKKHFKAGEKFDLVLLDLSIPHGKGGIEIMPDLLTIDPEVVALIASGSDMNPVVKNYASFGFAGILLKPFDRAALLQVIRQYAPQTIKK